MNKTEKDLMGIYVGKKSQITSDLNNIPDNTIILTTDEFNLSYNDLSDKPTIPTIPNIEINVTGSGNVISDIQVDKTNKHKLNITKVISTYTKTEIDALIGDIESALTAILGVWY